MTPEEIQDVFRIEINGPHATFFIRDYEGCTEDYEVRLETLLDESRWENAAKTEREIEAAAKQRQVEQYAAQREAQERATLAALKRRYG